MAELWFNQNGDSTTGLPVAVMGTPQNQPPIAALPAPGSTPAQVAADPGYLIPGQTPSILQGGAGGPDVLPQEDPLESGDRVRRMDGVEGTATGMALKTLPAKYQINWDDGTSSNDRLSDITIVSRVRDMVMNNRGDLEPSVTDGPMIGSESCNENQYTVPGVDKCIDKTAALVLGAIALYLILNKKK